VVKKSEPKGENALNHSLDLDMEQRRTWGIQKVREKDGGESVNE